MKHRYGLVIPSLFTVKKNETDNIYFIVKKLWICTARMIPILGVRYAMAGRVDLLQGFPFLKRKGTLTKAKEQYKIFWY